MAKKHVINYYKQVQDTYFEMLNDVADFDKAYKDGIISQEQFDNAQILLEKIKDNYERLSYILLLLNQPSKKEKLKKFKNQNKKVYSYLENVSQDKSISESEDALKELKELIRKEKK